MNRLELPRTLWQALLEEARRCVPQECCGLLGGRGHRVTKIFPATNQQASPVAYEIAPRELFGIFRQLRAETLELVGIYHSHPSGDNTPSPRDRELAYYPEAAYVIVSPQAGMPRPVRAFLLSPDAVWELRVEIVG